MHGADEDDLVVAAATPSTVKAAAAFVALAGLFVALTGLQAISFRWSQPWRNAMPLVFLALGVAMIPLGAMLYRGRAFAAIGGLACAGICALGTCTWFVVTWGSVFSLMNIAAVPLCVLGALFSGLSIPATRRMAEARARLADQGLDVGF